MFTPHSFGVALVMMVTAAICWGSWANTFKGVKRYRFELFYWEHGQWPSEFYQQCEVR
jgi:glucose uptake protein